MNVIISSVKEILDFGKANSLRAIAFGTSCCAEELQQALYGDFHFEEFNSHIFTNNPKEANLLICAGPINVKMASCLKNIYNKMSKPSYVIAMGVCACSGGMFSDSYTGIQGIDKILPVDIYLPGCPPKPEALFDAIKKLQNSIITEKQTTEKEGVKADLTTIFDDTKHVESPNTKDLEVAKP